MHDTENKWYKKGRCEIPQRLPVGCLFQSQAVDPAVHLAVVDTAGEAHAAQPVAFAAGHGLQLTHAAAHTAAGGSAEGDYRLAGEIVAPRNSPHYPYCREAPQTE